MTRVWRIVSFGVSFGVWLLAIFLGAPLAPANAQTKGDKWDGIFVTGFWYLQNNVSSTSGFVDDGIGEVYVQNRYLLNHLSLTLNGRDLQAPQSPTKIHARFRGKLLYNPLDGRWALGINNKARGEIREMHLVFENVRPKLDIKLGRMQIFEAGMLTTDGLNVLYKARRHLSIGAFGGLSPDPRNLTGYIGPIYEPNVFSTDFQTLGTYAKFRNERIKTDVSLSGLLFKGKIDRLNLFGSMQARLSDIFSVSGLMDMGLAGDKGLKRMQLFGHARPGKHFRNTLKFLMYESLNYAQSDSSIIAPPVGASTSLIGTTVNTSYYMTVGDDVRYLLTKTQQVFGSLDWTYRQFDGQKRTRVALGFLDSNMGGKGWDLWTKLQYIHNFRSRNLYHRVRLLKALADRRIKAGPEVEYRRNIRDDYDLNNQLVQKSFQKEHEYSIRGLLDWTLGNGFLVNLHAGFNREVDSTNDNQKVHTYDVFLQLAAPF